MFFLILMPIRLIGGVFKLGTKAGKAAGKAHQANKQAPKAKGAVKEGLTGAGLVFLCCICIPVYFYFKEIPEARQPVTCVTAVVLALLAFAFVASRKPKNRRRHR